MVFHSTYNLHVWLKCCENCTAYTCHMCQLWVTSTDETYHDNLVQSAEQISADKYNVKSSITGKKKNKWKSPTYRVGVSISFNLLITRNWNTNHVRFCLQVSLNSWTASSHCQQIGVLDYTKTINEQCLQFLDCIVVLTNVFPDNAK